MASIVLSVVEPCGKGAGIGFKGEPVWQGRQSDAFVLVRTSLLIASRAVKTFLFLRPDFVVGSFCLLCVAGGGVFVFFSSCCDRGKQKKRRASQHAVFSGVVLLFSPGFNNNAVDV